MKGIPYLCTFKLVPINWLYRTLSLFNLCLPGLVMFILLISSLSAQQISEVRRREIAAADRIKSDTEDILSRYFRRDSFIINVKVTLEKAKSALKEKVAETESKDRKEEIPDLPGLPIRPGEESGISPEKLENLLDKLLWSEGYQIKYLEITILLQEGSFTPEDINFIRTTVKLRSGYDEERGDSIIINQIPFPKITSASTSTATLPITSSLLPYPWSKYLPYLIPLIIGLFLLLVILQIMGLARMSRQRKRPYLPYEDIPPGLEHPSSRQGGHHPGVPAGEVKGALSTPASTLPTSNVTSPGGHSVEEIRMANELRQWIVSILVGDTSVAGNILKSWIETEPEEGIKRAATFIKSTSPDMISLLTDHIGLTNTANLEYAMNQIATVDNKSALDTFKKFREDFMSRWKDKIDKGTAGTVEADVFSFLHRLEPHQILMMLRDEQPGIAGVVLAQLEPNVASKILKEMPEDKQLKIPVEMGKLKRIPAAGYREIAEKMAKKALDVMNVRYVATDGLESLINLLEQVGPEMERQIIATISEQDMTLAGELSKVYLTFTDLMKIPDRVLAEVLRPMNRETIAKSLLNSTPELKKKVVNNVPERFRDVVTDFMDTLGDTSTEDVIKSQLEVTREIRTLARQGKIDLKKFLTGSSDTTASANPPPKPIS